MNRNADNSTRPWIRRCLLKVSIPAWKRSRVSKWDRSFEHLCPQKHTVMSNNKCRSCFSNFYEKKIAQSPSSITMDTSSQYWYRLRKDEPLWGMRSPSTLREMVFFHATALSSITELNEKWNCPFTYVRRHWFPIMYRWLRSYGLHSACLELTTTLPYRFTVSHAQVD